MMHPIAILWLPAQVLTIIATSAEYGMDAVHFYWLGAIPALVFLICVLLPLYERSGVRTIMEAAWQKPSTERSLLQPQPLRQPFLYPLGGSRTDAVLVS